MAADFLPPSAHSHYFLFKQWSVEIFVYYPFVKSKHYLPWRRLYTKDPGASGTKPFPRTMMHRRKRCLGIWWRDTVAPITTIIGPINNQNLQDTMSGMIPPVLHCWSVFQGTLEKEMVCCWIITIFGFIYTERLLWGRVEQVGRTLQVELQKWPWTHPALLDFPRFQISTETTSWARPDLQ